MKKNLLLLLLISFSTFAQQKGIIYNDGQQQLEGQLVFPNKTKKNKSAVLILPAWKGIDSHSIESAMQLSKLGYIVFVADIYGIDKRPKDTKEAGKIAGFFKNNFIDYQKRIQLALDQLVKAGANPNKIVVMGYCFGGTGAIESARANLKVQGVVSFHGGLGRDASRSISPILPKVLVLHGADDFFVLETEIKAFQAEMKSANADWQMIYYSDAVHAFTHKDAGSDKTKGTAYNEKADKRSWLAMCVFFEEVLN
jgi:dienelactone hydrolase